VGKKPNKLPTRVSGLLSGDLFSLPVIFCPKNQRFSFVFSIFHLAILLSCLTRDGFAKCVNEGCWLIKAALIGGGWFLTLFLPNSFFELYVYFAEYGSFVFLLIQSLCLIDLFYIFAEYIAAKIDKGNNCYIAIALLCSGVFYILTGTSVWNLYGTYYSESCRINQWSLVALVVYDVACVGLIMMKFHPNGSVVTSGAVSLLLTYWRIAFFFYNKSFL
jgi:hypothetical protein